MPPDGAGHTFPQLPQFPGSDEVSTHLDEQLVVPKGHALTQ